MTGKPLSENEKLRLEILESGVGRLPMSQEIGMPYGTLANKLGGYSAVTEEEATKIRAAIAKLSKK